MENRTIFSKPLRSSWSCSTTHNCCRNRHLRFLVAVDQLRNHQRNARRLISIRTGQNPESACGMWGHVAHLDHERYVEKAVDQPGGKSVCGCCPGLVRNPAFQFNRQEKRSNYCRRKRRAVPSTTSQRSRQAHCGVRGPVGCIETYRSGHGETKAVQPATRHVDAYRVSIVTNPPYCAPHDSNYTGTSRSQRGGSISPESKRRSFESS